MHGSLVVSLLSHAHDSAPKSSGTRFFHLMIYSKFQTKCYLQKCAFKVHVIDLQMKSITLCWSISAKIKLMFYKIVLSFLLYEFLYILTYILIYG